MNISYTLNNTKIKVEKGYNVHENVYKETTKNLSATRHLLFIWGGSCYKLIWHHILCWIIVYSLLSLTIFVLESA